MKPLNWWKEIDQTCEVNCEFVLLGVFKGEALSQALMHLTETKYTIGKKLKYAPTVLDVQGEM